jgi:hypothetical protein
MKERTDMRKQPTQTTPKGAEIPVPKRGDFMRDLRKAATPKPAEKPES